MKVYIVAVEDRDVDFEFQVHLSPERAIDEAREQAKMLAKELSDDFSYEELDTSEYERLIFRARYKLIFRARYKLDSYVSVYEAEMVE